MNIENVDVSHLEKFDKKIWEDIVAWQTKKEKTVKLPARLEKVRSRAGEIAAGAKEKATNLPGANMVMEAFQSSLQGLIDTISKAGEATVSETAVIARFNKRGHDIVDIEEIRDLTLREVIKTKPNLETKYTAFATVEGGAAGFVTTGGTTGALAGSGIAGVGALPGAGITAGAIAADIAAVMGMSSRVVAETAAYYGYDLKFPNEQVFASSVLGMGLGGGSDAAQKQAAFVTMNRLIGDLARRRTWEQLNKNVVTGLISKVYSTLGMQLTKNKLAQAVPVVGIAIGAGLNARMLRKMAITADYMYRQRFLVEKYDIVDQLTENHSSDSSVLEEDLEELLEAVIDTTEIVAEDK